jgi:hypothetical protein
VELEKMEILARTFDYQIETFPFTYLGLPMGSYKPKNEDFLPLVQRIERRLLSTSMFLNHAGRLEMVNSVLSALPIYHMGNLKLPPSIYNEIDKYRKHCMWRGADMNARKPPLVAWKLATRPKKNGGIGIINLSTQNDALLLKHLDRLIWDNNYSNGDVPSSRPKGSIWWKSILKLITTFKGIAKAEINDGRTVMLWHDLWDSSIRSSQFPELFSFYTSNGFTVAQAASLPNLYDIFHLPLSAEAYQQYVSLNHDLQELRLTEDTDIWSYIWGSSSFSIQKAYQALSGTLPTHPVLKMLWKTKCQSKHTEFSFGCFFRINLTPETDSGKDTCTLIPIHVRTIFYKRLRQLATYPSDVHLQDHVG